GEEVALENACRLRSQKLRPACLEPLRCRLDPCLPENRPDRARGELDPEPDQLALDPPVAPARVLTSKPHHQLTDPRSGRRSTRRAVGAPPPSPKTPPVPAQHRPWRNKRFPPPAATTAG